MNTVLRVKRKSKDVPLSSLVVGCKRPRTHFLSSDSADPDLKTVAHFAGTLLDVSEDFHKVVPKVIHFESLGASKSYKRMSDDEIKPYLAKKPRWIDMESTVEKIKISKYENPSRGKGKPENLCDILKSNAPDPLEEGPSEEKMVTFVDLEDTWSNDFLNKREQRQRGKDNTYVYDLYYVEMDEDVWFDSARILVQHPKLNIYDECSDYEDWKDSSDSNSESNWRNDYPDTETSGSDDSNDSMKRYLSDKSSSSSDDNSVYDLSNMKADILMTSDTSSSSSSDFFSSSDEKENNDC
ncbi:probable RNA polymerase II nuclear localization protein SLC7A6OS [Linepithema humile]|uniref:probable RNA polymerase II nuclear localization protein SLC7A6OS n=1 Tax=Linepithema humile TaxID=83485 RepID=UPI00351DF0C3